MVFNFEQQDGNELDIEPPLYAVPALLPGKPVTVKLGGCFIFLGIACFMPFVDFVSDIFTAGTVQTLKRFLFSSFLGLSKNKRMLSRNVFYHSFLNE